MALERRLGRVVRRRRRQRNLPLVLAEPARICRSPTTRPPTGSASRPPTLDGTEVTAGRPGAGAVDSLRAPLTRERFYFVMADRFANGDPTNDRGGHRRRPAGARLRPDRQGLLPRRRHRRAEREARLHRRARHHRDLADAELQEPPGPGLGDRRHRPATTATGSPTSPRSTRTSAPTPSSTAFIDKAHRPRHQGLLRHHHQPHRRRHRLRRGSATPTSTRPPSPTATPAGSAFDDRDYAGGDDVPGARRRRRRSPTRRSSAPRPTAPSRCRRGSTTRRNYHNRGDSTFAGESSTYGDFVGLDDLFTEQPDVVDGMTEIYETWVDFGIDGFRIDTVKHVNMEFWQEFAPAIRDHAARHRQRRLLRVRRGLRRQPGLPVDVHHRGPPRRDARLRLPGRRHRLRQGRGHDQAARLLRQRRLLHRHRLQRLLAADLPRQPRHGPDRQVPRRRSRPRAARAATSSRTR